jgi:integrase
MARIPEGIKARRLANGAAVYDVNTRTFRKRGFATVGEASVALNKARDDARAGRAVLDVRTWRVTVGDIAEAYLADGAPAWRQRTRDQYRTDWSAMADTFGRVPVVRLRASDVSRWLTAVSAEWAPRTVSLRLWLLRSILDRAAADMNIPNAARLVKRPRGQSVGKPRRARRVLSNVEVGALLDAATDRYRIAWLLALALGLRSGEMGGLTIDRVDFTTGAVRIDRQLVRARGDVELAGVHVHGRFWLEPLKAENSYDTLRAGPELLDAIAEHVERFGLGPHGLIVSAPHGGPLGDDKWSAEVERARTAAGVEMRGHDLRRTHGRHVFDHTGDITAVAAALRNDVATSVRAYLRPARADEAHSDAILRAVNAATARKPRARGHLRAL